MKKSIYVFVSLLISIQFWHLVPLNAFLDNNTTLLLTLFWAALAYFIFKKKPIGIALDEFRYVKYMYLIFAGVCISMFSAYLFWGQSLLTTFIAQRGIYAFVMLPVLLYIRPSEKDIIKALQWITIGTILAWCITIVAPNLIGSIDEDAIARRQESDSSDIGFYVSGIRYVVLYLYFTIHAYIKKFSLKVFLQASALLVFLILYQNRSLLIGAILVYLYSFLRFKSKYKKGLIFLQAFLLIGGVIYTWEIWSNLFIESQNQLADADYNRWKALTYYFHNYSPNWFCYVFGNGFPSSHNAFGQLMWDNFERGIYASDLGMIGMWTTYGLLPLISIYAVILSVLIKKQYPLYLKFISFHILAVPTMFHFWNNPGVFLFVLLIYLYALHTEQIKLIKFYAINNNSKL
jgi:hypothetical protein